MGEPLSARIERKNEKKGFHKKPSQPNECMEGKGRGRETGFGSPQKIKKQEKSLAGQKKKVF